ncbi:MAG: DNA gyrase inhibitor YacG [Sandaracinaceae bacterium]|nr:DNA gyrase inhibitor YacG [Sandaracinaceae bacterium]
MRSCPICKRLIAAGSPSKLGPFCSERCQSIDLGQWIGEGYRIGEGAPQVPAPDRSRDEQPS